MFAFQNWIRALAAASVISALARQLTPPGPVRRVTDFACGVMMLSMLLSPILRADPGVLADASADYRSTVTKLTEDMEAQEKQLLRVYIQRQTAAYILDEAQRIGVTDLKAEVLAKWRGESWVPDEVYLSGTVSPEEKKRLSGYLSTELGIAAERQHWNGY